MATMQSRWAPLLTMLRQQHSVTVTTVRRNDYNEELLKSLYSVGKVVVDEPESHFRRQVITNHLCHVFRTDDVTSRVVGFQCWKRVVWGDKTQFTP